MCDIFSLLMRAVSQINLGQQNIIPHLLLFLVSITPLKGFADVILLSPGDRTVQAVAGIPPNQIDNRVPHVAFGQHNESVEAGIQSPRSVSSIDSIIDDSGVVIDVSLLTDASGCSSSPNAYAAAGSTLPGDMGGSFSFQVSEPMMAFVSGEFSYASSLPYFGDTVVIGLSAAPHTSNLIFRGWGNVSQVNWSPNNILFESVELVPDVTYNFRWSAQLYSNSFSNMTGCVNSSATLDFETQLILASIEPEVEEVPFLPLPFLILSGVVFTAIAFRKNIRT